MANDVQNGKQPPRLNPFAFPADTDFRFVLLIILVLTSSLYIFWQLSGSLFEQQLIFVVSRCKIGVSFNVCVAPYLHIAIWWFIGGITLLLVVAVGIYLLFPTWKLGRNKLVPLIVDDAPEMVAYLDDLCHEVGLAKPPLFLLNPLSSGTDGLAFGRLGQYYVVLAGGLVTLFVKDRAAFRAILLHELAHLVNKDVNKTYFTIAIWWSFVAVALVPFSVNSMIRLVHYPSGYLLIGNEAWRILALSIVVYLTRNAVLRAREMYADVRASTWDGQAGALTRVLASLPRPKSRWRVMIDFHPNPEERLGTVFETYRLFRIGFWEAFGAGIAIGIALPIMQLIFGLVENLPSSPKGAQFEILGPALILAPFAVGVVGLGIWRATFAAWARAKAPTGVGRVGLCLGMGILLGTFLSFSNYFEPNSMNFSSVFVSDFPWNALLLIVLFFFFRWIATGASTWLDVATTGRSLRLIYTMGLTIASAVLVVWLAQFFGFSLTSEFIREGGLTAFGHTLDVPALQAQFLKALLQPETLLAFIGVWAFPLAARCWQRGFAWVTVPNWAFLDASSQRQLRPHQESLSLRIALTLGLQDGFVFCILLLVIKVGVRTGVPESLRGTDQFNVMFYAAQIVLAMLIQVSIAAIVAGKVRQLGSLYGLFAAWIGGCVMVLGLFDLNLLFGGRIDLSFGWQAFCYVVNGGGLLALLAAMIVSAVATRGRQMQPEGTPAIVPQKKSNRFLWIALSIVAGLFVLLCAYSVFFFVTPPTPTPTAIISTPTTILNTYCTAFKKGDYHTVYKQLSSGLQSQRTEATFTSALRNAVAANGGLSNCSIRNVIVKGQLAGGIMTVITGNGKRTIYDCVLIDPGDGWKIVSITLHPLNSNSSCCKVLL